MPSLVALRNLRHKQRAHNKVDGVARALWVEEYALHLVQYIDRSTEVYSNSPVTVPVLGKINHSSRIFEATPDE